MQFRVISSGNTVSLYPLPLDPRVPPLVLGGSQGLIAPLFPEFSRQLFAVTGYEDVPSRLGSGEGGPEKRHIIEVGSQLKLRQCLIGRLASDWADEPVVDVAFALLDYQVAAITWIQLKYLLQEMVRGMGVSGTTTLNVGTPCSLYTPHYETEQNPSSEYGNRVSLKYATSSSVALSMSSIY
ncbi:MAG: hypothetical protein WAT84_01840 [Candidatus Moraniibacteriota bacterium]